MKRLALLATMLFVSLLATGEAGAQYRAHSRLEDPQRTGQVVWSPRKHGSRLRLSGPGTLSHKRLIFGWLVEGNNPRQTR